MKPSIEEIAKIQFNQKINYDNLQNTISQYNAFKEQIDKKVDRLSSNENEQVFKKLKKEVCLFVNNKESINKSIEDHNNEITQELTNHKEIFNSFEEKYKETLNKFTKVEETISKTKKEKHEIYSVKKLASIVNQLDCVYDNIRTMQNLKESLNNMNEIYIVKEGIFTDKEFILASNKEKVDKKESQLTKISKKNDNYIEELSYLKESIKSLNNSLNQLTPQIDHINSYIEINNNSYIRILLNKDNEIKLLAASLMSSVKTLDKISIEISDIESFIFEKFNEYNYLLNMTNQSQDKQLIKNSNSSNINLSQSLCNMNFITHPEYASQISPIEEQGLYYKLAGCSFYYLLSILKQIRKINLKEKEKEVFKIKRKIIDLTERKGILEKDIHEKEVLLQGKKNKVIFYKNLKRKLKNTTTSKFN
jgi:hypothetical protein